MKRLALCIAALLLAGISAIPAQAEPPDPTRPDPSATSLPGFDAVSMQLNQAYERLSPVLDDFPETVGVVRVDRETNSIIVNLDPSAPLADSFRQRVESISFEGVKVQLREAEYTFEELEAVATDLTAGRALELYGVDPLLVTFDSEGVEVILPDSTATPTQARRATAEGLLGVPVRVSTAPAEDYEINFAAGTAVSDVSPYSGGAHLMTSNSPSGTSYCTSGFVWDKWTTRERMLSTAFHCNFASPDRPTTFFTSSSSGRKLVGTMRYTAPVGHRAADVMLLRAASGTSFNNPTVYVGPTDKRTVQAYTNSVGADQVAAKYGGTTGYTSFVTSGYAPLKASDGSQRTYIVADTKCRKGDSGGPMFWAGSNGKVTAAGTTIAFTETKCFFLPIGVMSQTVAATVLTG